MLSNNQKLWSVWGQANSLYSAWASAHELNYYLLFVLYALDGEPVMTQKRICDCTGLTKQTVNTVIQLLIRKDYITLSPSTSDRREKLVSLTESGAAYARGILASLHELEERVLQIMGNDRVQQMVDDITLFNTIFEKEMEKRLK